MYKRFMPGDLSSVTNWLIPVFDEFSCHNFAREGRRSLLPVPKRSWQSP